MKNKVVLYTGCGADKKRVEIVDFQCIDHTWINSVNYIRIQCDGKCYYYQTTITAISTIRVYEEKQ